MAKKKTDISRAKYSNLFSKVSTDLQNLLDEYKIEYATSDISLLRNNILTNLSNVGINESNYDNKKYDELKNYTMNLEIDKLYNTKYHLKNTSGRKPNKLERFSD